MVLELKSKVKSRLITSLLGTPITYISTYQFGLVDEILHELCDPQLRVIPLEPEGILEFDLQRGVVLDYGTKTKHPFFRGPKYEGIEKWLEYLTYPQEEPPAMSTDEPVVCLFKNVFDAGLSVKMQTFCLEFAARFKPENGFSILIVDSTPVADLPEGLRNVLSVVEIPKPGRKEIEAMFQNEKVSELCKGREQELRDELSRALQGLDLYEIEQILKVALLQSNGRITDSTSDYALKEKQRILQKSGVIEVVETDISLDDVGGLEVLKGELKRAAKLYRHQDIAESCGLPMPKGVLLIGMPGCGKSMIAKAAASEFDVSLLRLDISRLMGKYVGESEAHLRTALSTAEAAHPCVLWIDEIEKAFRGADAAGGNDILVMRMMGHFLTWQQERKTAVYIIATANDVMRDEFMRKGRFDQVYLIDFPNTVERTEIVKNIREKKMKDIQQQKKENKYNKEEGKESDENHEYLKLESEDKKDWTEKDDKELAEKLEGFSGAEILAMFNQTISKKLDESLTEVEERGLNIEEIEVTVKMKDFEREIEEMNRTIAKRHKKIKNRCKKNGEPQVRGDKYASGSQERDANVQWGNHYQLSAIEQIYECQEKYGFPSASKPE